MRIIPQSTAAENYGYYRCANVYRAENNNSPAFKSALYNPNSIIHKTNPILKVIDNYMARSINASRKMWLSVDKELEPYLKVIDIEDKKNPHVRMWDINDGSKKKYAVVLHGLSHNISCLQDMYKKIISDTEYAVIAPEYHGLTPENKEDVYFEPKKILRDVRQSIKYLNDKGVENKDITVIGHSFGGYAASKLARKYPDLESVILVSAVDTNEYMLSKVRSSKFRLVPKSIINAIKNHPWLTLPMKLIFNIGRQLKKVKSPVDIIHAKFDKCAGINYAVGMAYHCKNLRSFNMVDGYHRMNDNKINTIVALLNSNVSK